jgi:hypothetical protein
MNDSKMTEHNSDGNEFFDFEAASSEILLASTHSDLARLMQTPNDEDTVHMMLLTKSERDVLLAARTSKAQNCHQDYRLALPKPHEASFGFEEFRTSGAYLNYDRPCSLSTTCDDLGMPDYGNTHFERIGRLHDLHAS